MQFKLKTAVVVIGMIAALAYGCGGGDGDDTTLSRSMETPAENLSGKSSQTHVNGATIFADKIIEGTTLGNFKLDIDEVSTTTDENGQFDLYIPRCYACYNGYMLVSNAGMEKDASENSVPASPMLAPAGSTNVTPVTTLAALNPDLVDQIGEDYDADIASESGVSGAILQLAKIVEAILDLLSDDDNQVVTDMADKFAMLQHVADAFYGVDLSDDSAVNNAAATAVGNILDDEELIPASMFTDADAKQAIADSISQTIETITAAIDESADAAMESEILGAYEAAVNSGVSDISTKFKTVSTKITTIHFLDSTDCDFEEIQTDGFTGTKTLTATLANKTSKMEFCISGNNEYDLDFTYLGASISVTLNDTNSLRTATVECTNVDVIVAADGTITITLSDATQIKINGKNSAGELVLAEFDNTDTTTRCTPCINDIVTVDCQSVFFDFDALAERIEAELGSDSDLFEICRIGDHIVNIDADGVPFAPFAANIVVQ